MSKIIKTYVGYLQGSGLPFGDFVIAVAIMDGSSRRRRRRIPARYRYVVLADSPRDGGWVRVLRYFDNVESAEEAIELFICL